MLWHTADKKEPFSRINPPCENIASLAPMNAMNMT